MPISIALLFCIPIGLLFYFEARWLSRRLAGRYELRERRAARFWGFFGALLIPFIYCFGLLEDAFPGRLGKALSVGIGLVLGISLGRIVQWIMATTPAERR